MPAPVTTFDDGYSDPAASATGWQEARQMLESAELFWVCTVRPDGRPHVTPVVAVWADEAIWFSTGAGEVKFANPHVVLVAGANGASRLYPLSDLKPRIDEANGRRHGATPVPADEQFAEVALNTVRDPG
jgi:hypothetical protein